MKTQISCFVSVLFMPIFLLLNFAAVDPMKAALLVTYLLPLCTLNVLITYM